MKTDKRTTAKTAVKKEWRYKLPTRILAIICAVLLILTGTVVSAAGVYVRAMLGMISYDDGNEDYSDVPKLPDDVKPDDVTNEIKDPDILDLSNIELRGNTESVTNILLLGVDGRSSEGYSARSDTNMILSVNTSKKTIKLASILRDVWVPLSGRDYDGDGEFDYDKLNAAFYYGGFRMLSNTLADSFKIRIDQYIAVDFEAFEKAVDAMDGIDVELTAEEAQFIPVWSDDPDRFATPDNPDLEPLGYDGGVYHLNGQQTLAYCRIRNLYPDSDFARQNNQRKVIDLLMQKAKNMNFATMTKVLMAVLPYVKTNMTQAELLSYASQALQYYDFEIYSDFSLPCGDGDFENQWIGGGLGLWLTDAESSAMALHEYIYGDRLSNEDPEEDIVEDEAEYETDDGSDVQ